jgi:hypothetical protein
MSRKDNENHQTKKLRSYRVCSCGIDIKWSYEQHECVCGMGLDERKLPNGRIEPNFVRATSNEHDFIRLYNIDSHDAPYPVNCFNCPLALYQKCYHCFKFGEYEGCTKNNCSKERSQCCEYIFEWHRTHPDYWRDSFAKLQRLLRGIEKKTLTREDIEERAAILEYDGGLSRAEAERKARAA